MSILIYAELRWIKYLVHFCQTLQWWSMDYCLPTERIYLSIRNSFKELSFTSRIFLIFFESIFFLTLYPENLMNVAWFIYFHSVCLHISYTFGNSFSRLQNSLNYVNQSYCSTLKLTLNCNMGLNTMKM